MFAVHQNAATKIGVPTTEMGELMAGLEAQRKLVVTAEANNKADQTHLIFGVPTPLLRKSWAGLGCTNRLRD